jgi:hypothetical protein
MFAKHSVTVTKERLPCRTHGLNDDIVLAIEQRGLGVLMERFDVFFGGHRRRRSRRIFAARTRRLVNLSKIHTVADELRQSNAFG